MYSLEQKVDIILKYITTDNKRDKARLKREAARVLEDNSSDVITVNKRKPETTIDDVIGGLITEIGIPCSVLGYEYLVESIKYVLEDSNNITGITKNLYPIIAKKFDTTSSRVERAIRHSIEIVWTDRDLDNAYAIFGNTISASKSKPTNREFIAMCSREVARRMRNI